MTNQTIAALIRAEGDALRGLSAVAGGKRVELVAIRRRPADIPERDTIEIELRLEGLGQHDTLRGDREHAAEHLDGMFRLPVADTAVERVRAVLDRLLGDELTDLLEMPDLLVTDILSALLPTAPLPGSFLHWIREEAIHSLVDARARLVDVAWEGKRAAVYAGSLREQPSELSYESLRDLVEMSAIELALDWESFGQLTMRFTTLITDESGSMELVEDPSAYPHRFSSDAWFLSRPSKELEPYLATMKAEWLAFVGQRLQRAVDRGELPSPTLPSFSYFGLVEKATADGAPPPEPSRLRLSSSAIEQAAEAAELNEDSLELRLGDWILSFEISDPNADSFTPDRILLRTAEDAETELAEPIPIVSSFEEVPGLVRAHCADGDIATCRVFLRWLRQVLVTANLNRAIDDEEVLLSEWVLFRGFGELYDEGEPVIDWRLWSDSLVASVDESKAAISSYYRFLQRWVSPEFVPPG